MTSNPTQSSQSLQDAFGRRVTARLSSGSSHLPHEITERLRAARERAVAHRRRAAVPVTMLRVAVAGDASRSESPNWWNRATSLLPLIALAAGLLFIHSAQTERRASDLAEVDAAILTDDLPPSAYADPGFAQYLRARRDDLAGRR